MSTFKDTASREWTLRLDAPTIASVRKQPGIDLAGLDGSAYERMTEDPVLLVQVLWELCREQAQKIPLTFEQFADALVGDVLEVATAAMLDAIAFFFPSQKRGLVQAIAAKHRALQDRGVAMALAKINDPELEARIVAEMEGRMDAEIQRTLTRFNSATSTQALSDSTRGD